MADNNKAVGQLAAAKMVSLIKVEIAKQIRTIKAALDEKASKDVATQSTNGLMSAADKVKLDGVEDGATKTIVDDAMSDTSTNPVQNKVVMKYIDSRGTLPPVSTQNDTMLIQVVDGAYALRTKESIFPIDDALDTESKNAVENGVIARRFEVFQEHTQLANGTRDGLMSASDYTKLRNIESGANKTVVDAALDSASTNPVQNKVVKTALDGKAGTAVATASANGLMSKDDKTKLDGVEKGANKTTVDAALDAASENPVQNKAVKAALDGKLDKTGGTLTGNLRVTGALFSDSGLSFGAGENIHFTKAADDAGKLAHGAAGVDDTVPLARLKVAAPTEDDDAATKAYVDNNAAGAGAVRYDAAQTLDAAQQFQARKNIGAVGHNSPQFQGYLALAPANETLGSGVGLSPTGSGHNYTLNISDVDEGNPTLLTGVKTPTDADTNAAVTVEYVKNKVAGGGGSPDAVLYTAQTLTDAQKKQARENVDAASDFVVNGTLYSSGFVSLDKTFTQVQAAIQEGKQPVAKLPYGAVTALLPLVGVKENQFIFGTTATADDQNGIATLLLSSNGEATFDASFSPVLDADGYLPQISMGAAPTSDMQIATKQYVDDSAGKKLNQTEPVIKDGLTIENTADIAIRVQPDSLSSATGEDFANLDFGDSSPQGGGNGVVLSGLANFGDAEAAGLENTAVSYAQLLDYTKPLMLTYNNNQVTGASYADIRRAIERGRQIKLSVANTLDIIASNAKNETNRSVLRFTNTDVGGDTVNISQYNVTAQASGLTVNVKSHEIAQ